MPPRSSEARDAARFAEAQARGGIVTLVDGPAAGHGYFRDEYLGYDPTLWRRAGYVETTELRECPVPELRGYGLAVVWRFDPALVPAAEGPSPAPAPRPAGWCSKCASGPAGPGGVLCPGCRVRIESRRGESCAA